MLTLLRQIDALLAILGAIPLAGAQGERARDILALARRALAAAAGVSIHLDDLAAKLAAVRADVEAMAAVDHAVTADEMNTAIARVRAASAALHAALETAEAPFEPPHRGGGAS